MASVFYSVAFETKDIIEMNLPIEICSLVLEFFPKLPQYATDIMLKAYSLCGTWTYSQDCMFAEFIQFIGRGDAQIEFKQMRKRCGKGYLLSIIAASVLLVVPGVSIRLITSERHFLTTFVNRVTGFLETRGMKQDYTSTETERKFKGLGSSQLLMTTLWDYRFGSRQRHDLTLFKGVRESDLDSYTTPSNFYPGFGLSLLPPKENESSN